MESATCSRDRKSTRLDSSHTVIYTLSLHDALPIFALPPLLQLKSTPPARVLRKTVSAPPLRYGISYLLARSEERRVGKECRSLCDWSSDVCSSDLCASAAPAAKEHTARTSAAQDRLGAAAALWNQLPAREIGRATCRERV